MGGGPPTVYCKEQVSSTPFSKETERYFLARTGALASGLGIVQAQPAWDLYRRWPCIVLECRESDLSALL